MKYIKTSFIVIIIIISFLYYKFNQDNNTLFEDKLSMFIFVKSHRNIDDILFDLSSQIESFDEYIYNVHYAKDNSFLIKNKLKSQFDFDYINYKSLLESSDIIDFNIRIGEIMENYFLDHNSPLHSTKKYLLRDFLVRFYQYFESQIILFKKENNILDLKSPIEDFILGSKYIHNYKKEYYMMRIEFIDLNSIYNYGQSGMDSILNSILNYNSKIFNSELLFYNPHNPKLLENKFNFGLKQYMKEFDSLKDALNYHKSLILSDNVLLVESIYDYYFQNINNFQDSKELHTLKLNSTILDSTYDINLTAYKHSLLSLEEKLIALQSDDLTNDKVITAILHDLVGDGYNGGLYSKYIDLVVGDSNYIFNNMNRLFSYELQSLFEKVDQAENQFNVSRLPSKLQKHLFPNNSFKVRYFIE